MVRQIGISVLKNITFDNELVTIEALINSELATAYKLGRDVSNKSFKQDDMSLFNLNWHNLNSKELLIRLISSIKLLISKNLHSIHESMLVDPSEMTHYFQMAFSECDENENLHQNIL